jgi:phage shock protein A
LKEKGKAILDWFKVWISDKRENEETGQNDETNEEALTHLIRTLTIEMKKCRRQVGIVLNSEEKLQLQLNKHRNIVTKLQVELIKAAGQNNDRYALELIRKRKRYDQTVQQLEQQLAKHSSISDTIQETVRRIELKVEEARRKKLLLATQRQAYETSRKLSAGLEGYGGDNLLDAIEDDLTFLQAETRLSLDIDVERIGVEELERRLEEHAIEQHTDVPDEDELANLKLLISDERETLESLPDLTTSTNVFVISDDEKPPQQNKELPLRNETPVSNEIATAPEVAAPPVTTSDTAPPPVTTSDTAPPASVNESLPEANHDATEREMSEEDRELAMLKKELAMKEAELDSIDSLKEATDSSKEINKPQIQKTRPPVQVESNQETIMIINDDDDIDQRERTRPDILFITDD